ncbi:uncharacterized protein Dwil_GK18102 [Drosophila willistoni]|uniref:HTH myb-type domain-containing protein n=1 Tax=Drosophila willistoni TaxID=7260 RepID=B4MZ15_DROWI|nr:ZZ-type zinc finger-containing protein 3 [Drosophila willistoni]EDW77411.1 uncharacterized protein Dwil_GK18102 [Drosophila willistoni]
MEDDDDNDVFHFETEHLALRGNQNYVNLLRTIAVLQAQRIRVHQQIDELEIARKLYLENPELMLEKLRKNEPLIADNYMTTVTLPELPSLKDEPMPSFSTASQIPDQSSTGVDDKKASGTHSHLWTNDEQRRLEQLLIEYPPEDIEMRRFGKIAKALGNRTPQQVFSRVQKYFQKLHDAGMPVPGRIPKHRRPGLSKPKLHLRKSTFFPAQNITMQMPEDDYTFLDDLHGVSLQSPTSSSLVKIEPKSESETIDAEGIDTEAKRKQQLKVKLLTGIRDEKLQSMDGYNPDPLAPKCAECEEAAVTRTNWRCNSCYCPLNLCGDCLADQLINFRFEHITHDVVVDADT